MFLRLQIAEFAAATTIFSTIPASLPALSSSSQILQVWSVRHVWVAAMPAPAKQIASVVHLISSGMATA